MATAAATTTIPSGTLTVQIENTTPYALFTDKRIRKALRNVLDLIEMEEEKDYIEHAEIFNQLLTLYCTKMNTHLRPTSVSNDYVGVHLVDEQFDDSNFDLMIKSFKINQKLDAFYALKIISQAENILINMPNIRECKVNDGSDSSSLWSSSGIVIVGDLHGNYHDLYHIIEKYDIPGKKYHFIFNGDFVDRGEQQIEVLLTLLYAFIMRPDRVFLNRGNHEDIAMNTSSKFDPNFSKQTKKMYDKYGTSVFNAAESLFTHLPLATVAINAAGLKLFVVHGGISDQVDLSFIQTELNRHKFYQVSTNQKDPGIDDKSKKQISDILWSDPIIIENGMLKPKEAESFLGCCYNKHRNSGSLFGSDVTENFCTKYGFDLLIRSHQVKDKGFSQDQPKCYTVFSASCYCDSSNRGAVLKIKANDKKLRFHKYRNFISDDLIYTNRKIEKNHVLIRKFKILIELNEEALMEKFRLKDTNNTGLIDVNSWSSILSTFFNNRVSEEDIIRLKDFLCECENDMVRYKMLFEINDPNQIEQRKLNVKLFAIIEDLFNLIDVNNDDRLSFDELKSSIELVNEKFNNFRLSQEELLNFFNRIDTSKDGFIQLNEFKTAFLNQYANQTANVVV